ncbi:MAG: hypothetical protein KBD23_00865 [Gammaproteobacteria bacterium]|nr:hypothetical protein [Gammaproteobacteria bacterium]MBP9728680.1 hypothetical protein [Gammaproteobacteria bacterium]
METGLRIVLLLISCIIIAGIVWDYRRRPIRTMTKKHPLATKTKSPPRSERAHVAATTEKSFIVLHLLASMPPFFSGPALLAAFEKMHLFYGENQIFYGYQYPRAAGANRGSKLFSVLSMVEPGFFDLRTFSSFLSPGISLLLVLDDQMQPFAFESMLKTAKALALLLEATLTDQTLQPLSTSQIQAYRERVSAHLAALGALDLAIDN